MMKVILGFVSLFAGLLVSELAVAERALPQHFGVNDSCYAREYSAEHLAQNPEQTVSFIQFKHYADQLYTKFNPETGVVAFGIEVFFKDDSQGYSNGGQCRPQNGALKCQIECDGGGFVLKHKDADSILLYTRPDQGFAVAGCDAGDYRSVTDKTDDKIFLLHRLPDAQCIYPE